MKSTFSFISTRGYKYYLHSKIVLLAGKREQVIYYFKREIDEQFAIAAVPAGFEIVENTKTAMPLLKKSLPKQ